MSLTELETSSENNILFGVLLVQIIVVHPKHSTNGRGDNDCIALCFENVLSDFLIIGMFPLFSVKPCFFFKI